MATREIHCFIKLLIAFRLWIRQRLGLTGDNEYQVALVCNFPWVFHVEIVNSNCGVCSDPQQDLSNFILQRALQVMNQCSTHPTTKFHGNLNHYHHLIIIKSYHLMHSIHFTQIKTFRNAYLSIAAVGEAACNNQVDKQSTAPPHISTQCADDSVTKTRKVTLYWGNYRWTAWW